MPGVVVKLMLVAALVMIGQDAIGGAESIAVQTVKGLQVNLIKLRRGFVGMRIRSHYVTQSEIKYKAFYYNQRLDELNHLQSYIDKKLTELQNSCKHSTWWWV
jgi:hypothetical protein